MCQITCDTKYKHEKYKPTKMQALQNANCLNTNVTKYICNKSQIQQNANQTKFKQNKIQEYTEDKI